MYKMIPKLSGLKPFKLLKKENDSFDILIIALAEDANLEFKDKYLSALINIFLNQ